MCNKIIPAFLLLFTLIVMSGCSKDLSETEMEIISEDIPYDLFCDDIEYRVDRCTEYLDKALDIYTDQLRDEVEKSIDRHNSTVALFGSNPFDMSELAFGKSTAEVKRDKYNSFISYYYCPLKKFER